MKCKNCGNEVTQGSKFCGKCGTKIENETTDSTPGKKGRKKVIAIFCSLVLIGVAAVIGGQIVSTHIKASNSVQGSETVEKKYYDENGNTVKVTEEDGKGNIVKETTYDTYGNVIDVYQYEYVYDKKGNKKECIRYDEDGIKDVNTNTLRTEIYIKTHGTVRTEH